MLAELVREREAERVVVGLPLGAVGRATPPRPREARAFAARLAERSLSVPVELYDERFTTALAQRRAGEALARTPAPPRFCSRSGCARSQVPGPI